MPNEQNPQADAIAKPIADALIAHNKLNYSSLCRIEKIENISQLITDFYNFQFMQFGPAWEMQVIDSDGMPPCAMQTSFKDDAEKRIRYQYSYISRAYSYALGALLILAHNAQNENTNLKKWHAIQAILGDFSHTTQAMYQTTPLTKAQHNKLKKNLKKLLRQMAFIVDEGSRAKKKIKALAQAERYVCAELGRVASSTTIEMENDRSLQLSTTPLLLLTDDQQQELQTFENNKPAYFLAKPNWEREYLLEKYRAAQPNPGTKSAIERGQLGSANFTEYQFTIRNNDEQILTQTKTVVASVPSPIDIARGPERDCITRQNAAQVLTAMGVIPEKKGDSPALLDEIIKRWNLRQDTFDQPQANIPISYDAYLTPAWYDFEKITGGDNNFYMALEKQQAIQWLEEHEQLQGFSVADTTHPINGRRGDFHPDFKRYSDEKAKRFVCDVANFLAFLIRQSNQIGSIIKDNPPHFMSIIRLAATAINEKLKAGIDRLTDAQLTYFTENAKTLCAGLKKVTAQFPGEQEEQRNKEIDFLQNALVQYVELHNRHDDNAEKFDKTRNLPLHLAALQMLIGEYSVGVASGHCKSTKDRFGLVYKYARAVQTFFFQKGELPQFDDTGDAHQDFITIYQKIDRSLHMEMQSNWQSAGSLGLKDEKNWLGNIFPALTVYMRPKDIEAADRAHYVDSMRVAKLNKGKFAMQYQLGRYFTGCVVLGMMAFIPAAQWGLKLASILASILPNLSPILGAFVLFILPLAFTISGLRFLYCKATESYEQWQARGLVDKQLAENVSPVAAVKPSVDINYIIENAPENNFDNGYTAPVELMSTPSDNSIANSADAGEKPRRQSMTL